MIQIDDLEKIFTYQSPNADQITKYADIRLFAKSFGVIICKDCPQSNEKEIAIEKLRECVMWANAAIALNSEELKES